MSGAGAAGRVGVPGFGPRLCVGGWFLGSVGKGCGRLVSFLW